jgi:hypothetical protein
MGATTNTANISKLTMLARHIPSNLKLSTQTEGRHTHTHQNCIPLFMGATDTANISKLTMLPRPKLGTAETRIGLVGPWRDCMEN